MTQPTLISFVRHGEVYNPHKVLYGRLPRFSLSEAGIRQARSTGNFLCNETIDAVFSSPLLRARQTAQEILGHHPNLSLRTSRLLHEVLTPYQGCPTEETERLCGDLYSASGAGYEQPRDLVDRLVRFARRCRRQLPGRHVVAVTHGDPIAFLILWAHDRPLSPEQKTGLASLGVGKGYPQLGSLTTFSWSRNPGRPRLVRHWAP